MKDEIIKLCVWIINKMDSSPCPYGFINGLDNFSEEFLRNEVRLNPEKKIRDFLYEAMQFKSCMESREKNGGVCVIEDGKTREATEKDIQEITHLSQ